MRENPHGESRKNEALQRRTGLQKWISEVSWTGCSPRDLDRLEGELAASDEKRRVFIEGRIFSQCLREVFGRQVSSGLAIVEDDPVAARTSLPPDASLKSGGIAALPEIRGGHPSAARKSLLPGLSARILVAGLVGALMGFLASAVVRIGPPDSVGEPSKVVIRGDAVWVSGNRPAYSLGEGSLEVESPKSGEGLLVQTPSGKLEVSKGESRVELKSGAGVEIYVQRGAAVWFSRGREGVPLKSGDRYLEKPEPLK